jgi:hypothetical protein
MVYRLLDISDTNLNNLMLRGAAVSSASMMMMMIMWYIWAWRTMVERYRRGISWSIHYTSLKILPAESSSKAGGTGEGNYEFCLTKYRFYTSKGSSTCCKILLSVADGCTSHLKEGVQRIFVALKNRSPSAGFEPVIFRSNGKQANH